MRLYRVGGPGVDFMHCINFLSSHPTPARPSANWHSNTEHCPVLRLHRFPNCVLVQKCIMILFSMNYWLWAGCF